MSCGSRAQVGKRQHVGRAHRGYRFGLAGLVTAIEGEAPTTTARNSATVAGWTLVSRATGLLRLVVIGAVLGPTYFANCFQAGYVVPNIVFTLIAGPVLAMVLVPGVVRAIGAGGLPGPGRCSAGWPGGYSWFRPQSSRCW